MNLSIPDAAARALGVQPAVLDFRERIRHELPTLNSDLPEQLGELALALSHANTLYQVATRANDPLPALSEEGMKLRALLFSDAGALVQRGLVDGQALHSYKGSVGYRNLAFDLQMLAQLFRSCPESVRACSAARPADLPRAEQIAADILAAVRTRKRPDKTVEAAADLRNRAFTLFRRAYNQLRRAVVFLRWEEGDADELMPSLYDNRRLLKKAKKPEHPA